MPGGLPVAVVRETSAARRAPRAQPAQLDAGPEHQADQATDQGAEAATGGGLPAAVVAVDLDPVTAVRHEEPASDVHAAGAAAREPEVDDHAGVAGGVGQGR